MPDSPPHERFVRVKRSVFDDCYDKQKPAKRLSRSDSDKWLHRRHQLIRLLNELGSSPDRIRAEKLQKRVLQPLLKMCERRTDGCAVSVLQWHLKAARHSLDRLAYPSSERSQDEFVTLRTHLHSCVTMIDALVKSREPAAMVALFGKFVGGPDHPSPTPFTHQVSSTARTAPAFCL